MTTIPLEAQECANCYFARQSNKFRPNKTGTSGKFVYCHRNSPLGPEHDPVAPTLCDAWCGQWRLHPAFAELANV